MAATDSAAVRTEGVWKTFHQEAEAVHAVRDVSLAVESGEFTALAGPSGSGKTTLLNLIGGLTRPSRGKVWVAGREVSGMSNQALARLRLNEVGFVFQAYNLLPVLSAFENAEFPMLLRAWTPKSVTRTCANCSSGRAWPAWRTAVRANCRAASSSVSPWCVRWPVARRWC